MVCFQAYGGAGDAQRAARGKHYVLFDLPTDKGVEFKAKQPDMGWVSDIEGHPALPFSVAARIILPMYAERDERDVGLFAGIQWRGCLAGSAAPVGCLFFLQVGAVGPQQAAQFHRA